LKKITIIITLFLITVLSTGSYVVSKLYLKSYKKDFKAFVFKNKTIIAHTKIEIHKNQLYKNSKQLVWEDDNKEVVYKGHLYDIVDIQVVNDKVVLTVVSDTQEMNLKKQFASMYNENDVNQSSQPAKLLKQLLSLKGICHNDVFEFIKTTNVISFFQSNRFVIQTGVQCVETPPPIFS
jgi:hypothetical protein